MDSQGFHSDEEDNTKVELVKWSLGYVDETDEYVCGWCGQVLLRDISLHDLEAHFKSCKNTKKDGLLMAFKELRKLNQKFEALQSELSETKKKAEDKSKTKLVEEENEERKAEILNLMKKRIMQEIKTEVKRDILVEIKSEIITKEMETKFAKVETVENYIGQLKKSGEMRETAMSTLFNKINVLEEKMNEKLRNIDQVQGICDGATQAISNVFHSVEEIKDKNGVGEQPAVLTPSSDQLNRWKKESEALRAKPVAEKCKPESFDIKTELDKMLFRLKNKPPLVIKTLDFTSSRASGVNSTTRSQFHEKTTSTPTQCPVEKVSAPTSSPSPSRFQFQEKDSPPILMSPPTGDVKYSNHFFTFGSTPTKLTFSPDGFNFRAPAAVGLPTAAMDQLSFKLDSALAKFSIGAGSTKLGKTKSRPAKR